MAISKAELVRRESLSELRKLAGWFEAKHGLTITLLGGWAVYSYNPYLGSFDIDCLGPKDPFTPQLNVYMQANGYVREPESPFGAASESWKKPIYDGTTRIDDIYIDACDFEFKNVFREDPARELPYSLCIRKEYLERRAIDGEYFWVPVKELLFLYKAKAARDRQYILAHDRLPPDMQQRVQGKMDKDHSDLAALLDPRYGGAMNGSTLGDLIRQYDLSFMADTIKNLPNQPSVMDYTRQKETDINQLRIWIERLVSDSAI